MSFVRAALVAALSFTSFVAGCTSAEFNTAPTGPGGDSSTPGEDADGATGGDTAVDPCAPVTGIAKFCINVAKVGAHPDYTDGSGALTLGLDGRGKLRVYLYNEDPGDPARKTAPKPIVSIRYPSGDGTLLVDTELPVAIADGAPEGHYWFTVVFEDNVDLPRPDTYAAVPGDYIVVPPVVDNRLVFPEVTLKKDETQAIPVSLKPLRQVAATVQASKTLVSLAKTTRPEIHGDGPLAFLVYKGNIGSPDATFFDLAYARCIDLGVKGLAETVPVSFGTILDEGKYNVLGVLFDYDYPPPTTAGIKSEFPGKGSIVSPYIDGPLGSVVVMDIKAAQWLSTINVDMVDVPIAPGTTIEKQLCPGAK
jgi:hypothetical protein